VLLGIVRLYIAAISSSSWKSCMSGVHSINLGQTGHDSLSLYSLNPGLYCTNRFLKSETPQT
jgi:hypothetical protein